MDLEDLADAIERLEVPRNCDGLRYVLGLLNRLEAKLAPAIDAVNHSGEWEVEGAVSMVAWLRQHGRMAGGAAKTMTTVAARVAELPVTREAWEAGELSTGQVRAIAANVEERRVPLFAEQEAELVPDLVPLSVAQTSATMAYWRETADAIYDRPEERDTTRELSVSRLLDGVRALNGTFAAELGQVIDAALLLAATKDAETETRTPKQRRADALVDICRFYLDNQVKQKGGRHRPHLNLVADIDDLKAGLPGRFIDGTVAASSLIESILCDCNVHRVLTQGRSAILDYGRSVRTAPPDVFNALALRDGGCREPGCDRPPEWCDGHHVEVWEEGGPTSLANMVLKCTRHHHLGHKRRKLGWTERLEPDGTLHMTDPNGRVYVSYPDGPLAQRQLWVS